MAFLYVIIRDYKFLLLIRLGTSTIYAYTVTTGGGSYI